MCYFAIIWCSFGRFFFVCDPGTFDPGTRDPDTWGTKALRRRQYLLIVAFTIVPISAICDVGATILGRSRSNPRSRHLRAH